MRRPIPAALLAAGSGLWAATLQFAGALKSLPGLADLPADLTLLAGLGLFASLLLLLPLRRWRLAPGLALPLAGAGRLLLWLRLAGGWSLSRDVLAEKLVQIVLLGPPMLFAGMLVGAEPTALRRCCMATIGIGLLVAAATTWGVVTGTVMLGGEAGADPDRVRVQYQLVGLAIASAGGVAAVQAVAGPGWARAGWLLLVALLAAAVLIPGGRAALLAPLDHGRGGGGGRRFGRGYSGRRRSPRRGRGSRSRPHCGLRVDAVDLLTLGIHFLTQVQERAVDAGGLLLGHVGLVFVHVSKRLHQLVFRQRRVVQENNVALVDQDVGAIGRSRITTLPDAVGVRVVRIEGL